MYLKEIGYDLFMLSEALFFGMAVTPSSLSFMVVIKVLINELNSAAYMVGLLRKCAHVSHS